MAEKYLYFRTQPTDSSDDDPAQSACWPASSFMGMHPSSRTSLALFFKCSDNNLILEEKRAIWLSVEPLSFLFLPNSLNISSFFSTDIIYIIFKRCKYNSFKFKI